MAIVKMKAIFQEKLKKWDDEHWKMLMDNAPEQFNIKHYISIAQLERKNSKVS